MGSELGATADTGQQVDLYYRLLSICAVLGANARATCINSAVERTAGPTTLPLCYIAVSFNG
jgi:hypothetical protein